MHQSVPNGIKMKIVQAVKTGLNDTQVRTAGMRFKRSIHFLKMDLIADEAVRLLEAETDFKLIQLPRGGYPVLLMYYIPTGTIYSIMSKSRFKTLINRRDFSRVHYFDALVDFNDNLEFYQHQLVIDDELCIRDREELDSIKNQVRDLLGGNEPQNYVTVEIDMNWLTLVGVEAILTSEYIEVLSSENWSEFIEIDYSDLEYSGVVEVDDNDDLGITLRPEVIRKGDVSKGEINPKQEERPLQR